MSAVVVNGTFCINKRVITVILVYLRLYVMLALMRTVIYPSPNIKKMFNVFQFLDIVLGSLQDCYIEDVIGFNNWFHHVFVSRTVLWVKQLMNKIQNPQNSKSTDPVHNHTKVVSWLE